MTGTKLFWFGIFGVIFFVASVILGGLLLPGYNHASQLISESYATPTPYGPHLRYAGFIPAGIFIMLFAFLAIIVLPKSKLTLAGFTGLGIFYGFTTIIAGLFPCEEGCDTNLANPGLSQWIHNLAGALTYMIVPFCLLILGIAARKWGNEKYISHTAIICSLISFVFVNILSSNLQSGYAGLYQRIIECSILSWILICSFYVKNFKKVSMQQNTQG